MFLRLLVSLLAGHIPGGCEERGQVAGFSYAKMTLTSEYPQRRREHHTGRSATNFFLENGVSVAGQRLTTSRCREILHCPARPELRA